jgi:hypothetical protein
MRAAARSGEEGAGEEFRQKSIHIPTSDGESECGEKKNGTKRKKKIPHIDIMDKNDVDYDCDDD